MENIHEGGFAGAVLTHKGEDLVLADFEVDRIAGEHAGKTLCHSLDREAPDFFIEVAHRVHEPSR